MKKYYVFRVAKGFDSGSPTNKCPVQFKSKDADEIRESLNNIEQGEIPYEVNNYQDFLHKEFWNCGKLRQGWGAEGLDLNICDTNEVSVEWIKNYVLSAKRDWNVDINMKDEYCHIATGRFNILKHMLHMESGDIIIVPKHSYENRHDDKKFVICQVLSPYYFDLNRNYRDFGHTIIVKILGTFEYKKKTIIGKDFQPYQKAINRIKDVSIIQAIDSLILKS